MNGQFLQAKAVRTMLGVVNVRRGSSYAVDRFRQTVHHPSQGWRTDSREVYSVSSVASPRGSRAVSNSEVFCWDELPELLAAEELFEAIPGRSAVGPIVAASDEDEDEDDDLEDDDDDLEDDEDDEDDDDLEDEDWEEVDDEEEDDEEDDEEEGDEEEDEDEDEDWEDDDEEWDDEDEEEDEDEDDDEDD